MRKGAENAGKLRVGVGCLHNLVWVRVVVSSGADFIPSNRGRSMQMRQWVAWAVWATVVGMSAALVRGQGTHTARLVVQLGHSSRLSSVAISPDGRYVITGAEDNSAVLWEAGTGRELRHFREHSRAVTAVAFSADGRNVLTGSADGTAKLWNAASGDLVRVFDNKSVAISTLAFAPMDAYLVTGDEHGAIVWWDISTGQEVRRVEGRGRGLKSLAISRDGHYLLTGDFDGLVRLWNSGTGIEIRRFDGSRETVACVAFSPDGTKVLASGWDGIVRLWNRDSGAELLHLHAHGAIVFSATFTPDGRNILMDDGDNSAGLWDTSNGNELRRFTGHQSTVRSVVSSADGHILLTGSWDGTAKLWDVAGGKQLRTFEGWADGVNSVAVSATGHLISTGGWDHTATIWNTTPGQVPLRLEGHTSGILSVALSQDDKLVLTGSADHTARLWDTSSGAELHRFEGHTGAVLSVTFSLDHKMVLTGSEDGTARLWDAASAHPLLEVLGHTARVYRGDLGASVVGAAFTPDGQNFLTGCEDMKTRLWDVKTGKLLKEFEGHFEPITSLALSADGSKVLTGSTDETALLQDAKRGMFLQEFRLPSVGFDIAKAVAVSPDATKVLVGYQDGVARIWDAASGEPIRPLPAHAGPVTSVAFARDGSVVVTSSVDGTTRVSDAATGEELVSLVSFKDGTWAAFDPEGRFDTNQLDGGAQMQWVVNDDPMHALPLEIFMRDYYTPGLLARVMKSEKLPEVRSIAEIKNRVQPEVKVVSVTPSEKTPGRVDVVVHAANVIDEKGMKSGLKDLRLFRDGQMVADGYRKDELKDGDFVFRDVMLKSDAKKVTFTAYAFNSERIKSATASYEYEVKTPASAAVKRRAFLLQVGVNHTAARGCELKYSVNDAETMSAALSERLRAEGFEVEAVKLESVAGSDANGAAKDLIRAKLAEIAAKATPDDAFFMSFSGHGYSTAGGAFYVLPSSLEGDCTRVDDAMLKTAISADELADWLRPIDAGEMTLILDACYSAESVQAGDFKPGPMGSRGLGQMAYDKRMRVLAASQSDAVAHEYDYLHQGLLSYVLVQDGLEKDKADWKPKDGKITVGEWLSYAAAKVPEFKPDAPVGENKGTTVEKTVEGTKTAGQVPALFDFSRRDTLVLSK